jgi:hypothetical protein
MRSLAKNPVCAPSMGDTDNEKVATEPHRDAKPATFDQSKGNENHAQEYQKLSMAHAVGGQ